MDTDTLKKERMAIMISAMNILAGREHSIAELRRKLGQKHRSKSGQKSDQNLVQSDDAIEEGEQSDAFSRLEGLIDTVIEQLIQDKVLDESRFAQSFIRSRTTKGSGPVKIRHELMERGISSELIDEYLDETFEYWQEHIEAVRSKRFGRQYPEDFKEQSKQSRFLYQRGFGGELIRRLFNELCTE